MKRKIKFLIGCMVTISIFVCLLGYMTGLTERKSAYVKYKDFYDQESNFDVLFLGSSHMLNGVFPMELWKDYGIVSYNFGGHSNRLATTYWVMKNALDYTKPKVVVIDCWGLSMNSKIKEDESGIEQLHISFDSIPLGKNKIKALLDIIPEYKNRIPEFLWDFIVYHNRWNELTEADFAPAARVEKGAESRIRVAVPNEFIPIDGDRKMEGGTVSELYLEKIIEECREDGIEVLLTYLPFPAGEGWQLEANRVYDIAEEQNVNYINFLALEDCVDFNTDCYDNDSHLNPSGARKVTDFLGRYLTENYELEDQRQNPEYESWHQDYKEYIDFKVEKLGEQTSLNVYLMLLRDKSLRFSMQIDNGVNISNKQTTVRLLENLGIDTSRLEEKRPILVTVDLSQNSIKYEECDSSTEKKISFIVYNNETGEAVTEASFTVN